MPLVYADTSALFPMFHPRDEFSLPVLAAIERYSPEFVYWSFLRFELRHNLRRARTDEDGETAWAALRAAERTHARFSWKAELNCESLLLSADDLSSEYSSENSVGSADLIHIAAARRLHFQGGLDGFWTCDGAQARAAKAIGLKVRLFRP